MSEFIQNMISTANTYKNMAEKAFNQVPEELLRKPLDENTNSIAVIIKHISGNLQSRWTDFLTADGEKEWRKRDTEFIDSFKSKNEINQFWEKGWNCLFSAWNSLNEEDLDKSIFIRKQKHTVMQAMLRCISHLAYHTGQIVLTARFFCKDNWEVLSVPRGKSKEFNRKFGLNY